MAEYWLVGGGLGVDPKGDRIRTQIFTVWDATNSFNESAALAAIPIYRRVTRHPDDPYAICNEARADQVTGSLGIWTNTYTYGSAPLDSGSQDSGSDPTGSDAATVSPELRPWVISSKTVAVEEPILIDTQGNKMVASNGQSLEGATRIRPDDVITITGFLPISTDIIAMKKFKGTINNGAWQGWPAKCLKCIDVNFKRTFTYDAWFFEFGVELQFKCDTNPDTGAFLTWHPVKYMDRGSYVFESMSLPPQAVKDAEGNPTHDMMPLNGAGKQLTQTQILAGSFVYLDRYPYIEKDWSTFLT